MAKTFKLDILACDKYFFSGDCEEVIFPSIDGSRGVMAGHEPMICCLSAGEIQYRCDGEWHRAIVSEGFLEVMPDFVKMFADTVERPEDIDIKRAEAAKARAEERLRQQLSTKQYYHTKAALNRAMARIKAAGKH
ncbi:ATP synthase F1 subunit epsilon [Ruminococcus sp. 210702-SL.1.03]|jgi:F-type H+-transporting ATPase subunit epsilon|uniref:ATP synthase F1 subunit epsilon n=1 Tax=Ruminococcus sp. 210702-SL.1.03 TaxID=2883233 RepID=UPI001D071E81|nr:ATP synthase F1 subunit epsilon [Ruminococcus sp. 210702-SL.1.03]MCB6615042.1 ATP synthase F1 subunit epsilon [Ruminococcus sp. 210702-SL.1.03]